MAQLRNMSRHTLLLSSGSYPWDTGVEQTFFAPELPVLNEAFDRVVLIPHTIGGTRLEVPSGVAVEEGYAQETARLSRPELLLRAARTTLVAEGALRRGTELADPRAIKALLAHAGRAHHAREWLIGFFRRRGLDPACTAVVTFWWGAPTTGFALAKRQLPGLRVFTRAHGFDLYEDRHDPPYLPCRHVGMRLLDGVFPDSDKGTEYLRSRYPAASAPCETARMGLPDPMVRSAASADGVLRVVSCSLQRPIKRLGLLLEGVAAAGRHRPSRRVEWTHFGTGPLQAELEARASSLFPANVSVCFAGYSTQADLLRWYGEHPVDVFANVSVSEGTAVSLIEAVACGIPVLATRVGGNPEVVSERNGLLLSPDPDPEEIAVALHRFLDDPAQSARWREGSRGAWAERYHAERNYTAFARMLKSHLPEGCHGRSSPTAGGGR